ncbi:MAG: hypothetical protein IIU47_00015, partial [Lachnospiraceae bacterium]|nr:hypothetical protein [Lachnospiraceae bacterium]
MQAEWAIEHKIGIKTLNQVDQRDPQKTIHIMTWDQLLQDFDMRNERGVPYVIHLRSGMQLKHEEDILESSTVTDHFRLN